MNTWVTALEIFIVVFSVIYARSFLTKKQLLRPLTLTAGLYILYSILFFAFWPVLNHILWVLHVLFAFYLAWFFISIALQTQHNRFFHVDLNNKSLKIFKLVTAMWIALAGAYLLAAFLTIKYPLSVVILSTLLATLIFYFVLPRQKALTINIFALFILCALYMIFKYPLMPVHVFLIFAIVALVVLNLWE